MANKGPFKGKGKDKGTMNADDAKRAEEEYWVGIEVKREMYAFLVEAGFKGNEQWDFFFCRFFLNFSNTFLFRTSKHFFQMSKQFLIQKFPRNFFQARTRVRISARTRVRMAKAKTKDTAILNGTLGSDLNFFHFFYFETFYISDP